MKLRELNSWKLEWNAAILQETDDLVKIRRMVQNHVVNISAPGLVDLNFYQKDVLGGWTCGRRPSNQNWFGTATTSR
eukprot:CAMPEP_0174334148 /NCGR_PEP_ID=MMETSP0810-20121108/19702_1 /TAXON_ID=73025 ORGANISM="Eutreptiella gymnastica-like, Strain CCMP1594" /NCGR_SAMPLE_ID=MMETSP0810 /ASSEMBLY_ACC=CAM_ASM_000659 /LENGTH=76 /DNA_ID=CAMNT_0015451655 /DNA_START=957 /DNA_END=1187 /DNA_ORIENTATION=+